MAPRISPYAASPHPATSDSPLSVLEATLQATGLLKEHPTAEVLGIEVSTLRRWRWSGEGPPFIKVGTAVRYDPRDLAAYIDAGRRRSTSDARRAE